MKTVKLVISENRSLKKIAYIYLNNEKNLNAIDLELFKELKKSLEMIAVREDIGVLILSSDLSRAFSTGVDVKFIQTLTNKEASHFFNDLSILLDDIAHFPIPTITVLNGYTLGAGADLAISSDIRIASSSTVFRFPGPQFGLILGTKRLINEIGASKARFLTLSNTKVNAETAKNYGLVHEVCEGINEAHELALSLANTLLNVPATTARMIKELSNGNQNPSPYLTRDSVLQGDFKERFEHYITK
jgi:enoyl-CoA hydratase/carnithine racemase